jgi:hypothetical protein
MLATAIPGTARTLGQNPVFFLVGVPGSGTTLLQQLLNGLPELTVAPDVHRIAQYYETRAGLNREGLLASELVHKWIEQKRFDPFEVSRADIQSLIPAGKLLPLGQFISQLLDLHGKVKGKRLVGSRTLDFLRLLPEVRLLWPEAKVVHLIRDGRNVCLTLLAQENPNALSPLPHGGRGEVGVKARQFSTWAEDPLTTTALWWAWLVRRGRQQGQLKPEHYFEMRYESLRAEPAEECAKLAAFLGVPFDKSAFRFDPCSLPVPSGSDRSDAWLPHTDWRAQMSAADAERFEAVAGSLLDELGYSRAQPCLPIGSFPEVQVLAQRFVQELERPVPSPQALAERRRLTGMTNPFVFIVGCPRSGTTLLQRIVDAHPDLAICPETFWVCYYFKKRVGLTPEGCATPELISRLFEYYKFYRMKLGREELESLCPSGSAVAYADFVAAVFDRHGETRGKPLVGDKTPDYVRNLPTLHSLWPRAKFVHLIRDGRDVCLSAINWKRKAAKLARLFRTWWEDPVVTAALWWEWHVRQGREGGRGLGEDLYCELRYEALVTDTVKECSQLCAFLGLSFHERMLRFHEGQSRPQAGLDAKTAWLPITPGLRDWRSQMPPADIEAFEAAVGDLIDELGYPRAFPRPRPEVRERAERIRAAFVQDSQALGDWLP